MIYILLKSLLLPPGIFILGILAAFVFMPVWRGFSIFLIFLVMLFLYMLSTSMGASVLMTSLYKYPPLDLNNLTPYKNAKAIVVLTGGDKYAPELGGRTVSTSSLMRERYAGFLYQKTLLPIIVAGGKKHGAAVAESTLIGNNLERKYGVPTVWLDMDSQNTYENGMYVKKILDDKDINSFYLVTSASHMPRAVWIFKHLGFNPIPAPTDFEVELKDPKNWQVWLPTDRAFYLSCQAIHEYMGLLWYKIKYF